jgi:aspartate kinase
VIVQKYGGSSVATPEKIRSIAEKIKKRVETGEKLVVVVSAMGKTTNNLIELAGQVSKEPLPRELDMLLATGEQVSAALLAMSLNDIGVPAVSYNAFQLGMVTTGAFCNARIVDLDMAKLERELERRHVVVVTGFQGITPEGEVTTLGRGGSDTSAVAIAAKAKARCEIYSDVAGIYTCDPKICPSAKKLDYVTYSEVLELSSMGAKVLHSRAVEIAKKYNVELYCASTFSDERGTLVVSTLPEWLEQPVVTGVTADPNQRKVTISPMPGGNEAMSVLFTALAEKSVNVDMISTVNDNGHSYLTFTVVEGKGAVVRSTVEEVFSSYSGWRLTEDDRVAKISAVGVGMESAPGVAARFFSALCREKISMLGTSTSEIKISTLVTKENADRAVKALVEEFGLTEHQK